MKDSNTTENNSTASDTRSDLDGEEYRDASFYQPISTREYFKLLGYCVIVLAIIGFSIILFFRITD